MLIEIDAHFLALKNELEAIGYRFWERIRDWTWSLDGKESLNFVCLNDAVNAAHLNHFEAKALTSVVLYSERSAHRLFANMEEFVLAYGLDVGVELFSRTYTNYNTRHHLKGNLVNVALHLHDDTAASKLLDMGIANYPAYYDYENCEDWESHMVHPIEPATSFELLESTKRLLARGVDFTWSESGIMLGIGVLHNGRALTTLEAAGWTENAHWLELAKKNAEEYALSGDADNDEDYLSEHAKTEACDPIPF